MKNAIFLDMDGTLIEDRGYARSIEGLRLLPGVAEGLNLLKKDFIFFIITNQPGIGKGFYTSEDFSRFNAFLLDVLGKQNVRIEKTCFCPHEGGCGCRKPSTKFVEEIAREHGIDLAESWVVGDHPSDILMGKNAGCRMAYLLTGHGTKHFRELETGGIKPTLVAQDFLSAARGIMENESRNSGAGSDNPEY